MSEFVDSLRQEHAEIKGSLNRLAAMDFNNKEARIMLMEVKEIFINHIKKEDDVMYPRLKEASSSDENLMHILKYMEDEIELISKFVFIFFDKYSKKSSSDGFEREFSLICSTLITRIEKEEAIFFPEYEKICG